MTPRCCYLECDERADFTLWEGERTPENENNSDTCAAHLGPMLVLLDLDSSAISRIRYFTEG